MQRYSTAIDRQNISVLPTDERIFPADVVALARKIDALEIQWEESHVAASKEACEQNLKSAELLDAQALKNKILAGDTEGLDATPNVDRAHRENHAASITATATHAALEESYRRLGDLMIEHADKIIANARAEFQSAADAYQEALNSAETQCRNAAAQFDANVGLPRLITALQTRNRAMGFVPEQIAVPELDLSKQHALLERQRTLIRVREDLPAYTGVQHGHNGIDLPVNVLVKEPAFSESGQSLVPNGGRITMDDGVELTVERLQEIKSAWRDLEQIYR
jgi:hypothetical protein